MTVIARRRSATADQHGHIAASVRPTIGGQTATGLASNPKVGFRVADWQTLKVTIHRPRTAPYR